MTEFSHRSKKEPIVVMVGTGFETMGGISTVVKGYISAGMFDLVPVVYVETHGDGDVARKLKLAARGYVRFFSILVSRKVRLVHIHLSSRSSFWRKLLCVTGSKLFRIPVLLHLHGSEFMTFYLEECGPVRKRIVASVFNGSDAVIVLSPHWADNVRKITHNPNIEVIFNGVPIADTPPQRLDRQGPVNVLFLGRLGRRKGIYDLLDALVKIRTHGIEFHLTAAGDGEVVKVLSKVRELALTPFVEVPGWIDEQRKDMLLAQADIFVLPSHAEGLPMSLLEAMAAGLPVVCSSVGGIPTALSDGSEGYIVPPGDVDALASALTRLLTSAELRKTLGQQAFERAKRDFDVRQAVGKLVSLYDRYGAI